MSKNFEVNTKMDFMTYIQTVDKIVSEYFDINGEYCPHIGRAYVMQLFYKQCVNSEELEAKIGDNMNEIEMITILSTNEKFMDRFNKALSPICDYALDFTNAYNDAMEIVEDRKSSAGRIVDMLKSVLDDLIGETALVMTEDNLAAIRAIAENLTGGKSTAEAIVENYAKSDAFKKIVNMKAPATETTEK